MMKRGRVAAPFSLQHPEGETISVPAGNCWVLERPSWVLLMWHSPSGPEQTELALRDYTQKLRAGEIHLMV